MKNVKTFVVVFKSGRRDRFFAYSLKDLKNMCNWDNVDKVIEVK